MYAGSSLDSAASLTRGLRYGVSGVRLTDFGGR